MLDSDMTRAAQGRLQKWFLYLRDGDFRLLRLLKQRDHFQQKTRSHLLASFLLVVCVANLCFQADFPKSRKTKPWLHYESLRGQTYPSGASKLSDHSGTRITCPLIQKRVFRWTMSSGEKQRVLQCFSTGLGRCHVWCRWLCPSLPRSHPCRSTKTSGLATCAFFSLGWSLWQF